MQKTIDITICDKQQLIPFLKTVQPKSNLFRIESLLNSIKNEITFVIEIPYIDKHYRDSYYFYFSQKLRIFDRDCIRVHIFDNVFTDLDSLETQIDKYAGYFIIRPLEEHPLGHSMISPNILLQKDFVTCLSVEKIHLLGYVLEVSAFPHVAQDSETHSCAESSIWSLLTYFSQKYSDYSSVLPSDIIKAVNNYSNHKTLPSDGLTFAELSGALNSSGQNCMVYDYNNDVKNILQIYIESGMPAILALQGKSAGHAIVAIGHGNINKKMVLSNIKKTNPPWKDLSCFKENIVVIDDNQVPCTVVPIDKPAIKYTTNNDMQIKSFLVPFHKHMFMDAVKAYRFVSSLFNKPDIGLSNFGTNWITRLMLTTSNSFKEFIIKDPIIPDIYKKLFIHKQLPKFIWICELYEPTDYLNDLVSGILIIDSTEYTSYNSVIFYIVKDNIITFEDAYTCKGINNTIDYKSSLYKNNLKGDWNSWNH